jgi:hypothetical protein
MFWRIVLRTEGAGPAVKKTFFIRENEETQRIEMRVTAD